jgi:hypothetical protein
VAFARQRAFSSTSRTVVPVVPWSIARMVRISYVPYARAVSSATLQPNLHDYLNSVSTLLLVCMSRVR